MWRQHENRGEDGGRGRSRDGRRERWASGGFLYLGLLRMAILRKLIFRLFIGDFSRISRHRQGHRSVDTGPYVDGSTSTSHLLRKGSWKGECIPADTAKYTSKYGEGCQIWVEEMQGLGCLFLSNWQMKLEGIGSVYFEPEIGGRNLRLLSSLMSFMSLGNNLLAVLYLTRNCGYNVNIDDTTMHFMHGKQTVFTDQNAAFLNGTTLTASLEQAHQISTLPLDYSLWHHCLAHHNVADVRRMIHNQLVAGVTLKSTCSPDPI
jgi:hypothetical protein